ncbi:MAG: hypothetical protein IT294_07145 [Deltaproteobacteria bacterium]|nr:hypothetical protein [Deltaproteobacteria bacterium]
MRSPRRAIVVAGLVASLLGVWTLDLAAHHARVESGGASRTDGVSTWIAGDAGILLRLVRICPPSPTVAAVAAPPPCGADAPWRATAIAPPRGGPPLYRLLRVYRL